MSRYFQLFKVSTCITMIVGLLMGLFVSTFLPIVQVNAESTATIIGGEHLQLTASAKHVQQQTEWTIAFQAKPQVNAARFKIESKDHLVVEAHQADQMIHADTNGYFELTKAQLQDLSFDAPQASSIQVTLATKNEQETAFTPEGKGTYILSDSSAATQQIEEAAKEGSASVSTKASSPATTSSEAHSKTAASIEPHTESDDQADLQKKSPAKSGLGTGSPYVRKGAIKLAGLFNGVAKERPSGNEIASDQFIAAGDNKVMTDEGNLQNNGLPYDEVVLSGSNRAVGVWSKEEYRLDFSKSFKGRVYVNFGTQSADGFAFVMQNQGPQALTDSNTADDGQNLGVYGKSGAGKEPQTTAIQKSVAVEMDLYANTSGYAQYDEADTDVPHMAYSFPGSKEESYRSNSIFGEDYWTIGSKARINHQGKRSLNGMIGDNVQDGTWYEFLYEFNQETSAFQYYLRNPVTDAKTAVTTIPWETMKTQLDLAQNGNKAYWGFTAANGKNDGQIKFVFTQVPVDLGATVTNDVLVNGTSIVNTKNTAAYNDSIPAGEYGKDVTLRSSFAIDAKAEDVYAVTDWDSYLDPKLYDLSKGIKHIKVNGKEVADAASAVSEAGNVTVTFDPSINVEIGKKATLEYTASLKSSGATAETSFESQITAKKNTNGESRIFQGDEVDYWVKSSPKVTVIFQDTLGHELKRQSEVDIPTGQAVNISGTINDLFTSLGLDKFVAMGANNTTNVRNSYGGYQLKEPSLYENFDATKRETDPNSGYIYDYNGSGQLEMRVTLLSPISFTLELDSPNAGNGIADIIGWGDRIGFKTGNVNGMGGIQYAEFAQTTNTITDKAATLIVSQYNNNVTVYGMEGDRFDIRKWGFDYPVMKDSTETPNGTHVIGKIRDDSTLTLKTWAYGSNDTTVTVDRSLDFSGELTPELMWYKDTTGIERSLIVSPQTTDVNNDGHVDAEDTYQWLEVAPKWTLNLDGPKKLQFKLHLPDGSQKESEDNIGAYPAHKMPTSGEIPDPLPDYPAYQQLWGLAYSATTIDPLMTEYKEQLHQDYPASTFKLRSDSVKTVKDNQTFSDDAWRKLDLYFVSDTTALKGQFVDSDGHEIESEFPVKTNSDGTVEFPHQADTSEPLVPFDTTSDNNDNLVTLLKNSGKNIPAGYILAPDASFEYQLAENPQAIPIKLIKVEVPATGIHSSNQVPLIAALLIGSVVGVGLYLFKRRQVL